MGLVAEFEIHCEALPLVGVARDVPDADLRLSLQFNHGKRPLFLLTVTDGSQSAIEASLTDAHDVSEWTLVGEAGETSRYQAVPALSLAEQLGEHLDELSGLEALASADAIIERIEVQRYGWTQQGWFASREEFSQFASKRRIPAGTPLP
jgi:hypothetical protein